MNVFCKAYEIMRRLGWCQGHSRPGGRVCLLQALALARRPTDNVDVRLTADEVYDAEASPIAADARTLLKYLPSMPGDLSPLGEFNYPTAMVWSINDGLTFTEAQALTALAAACRGEGGAIDEP